MTFNIETILCIALLFCTQIFAYKEISGILERATDLKPEEKNALRPLFVYMQEQYNYIVEQVPQGSLEHEEDDEKSTDLFQYEAQFAVTQKEFEEYFEELLEQHTHINNSNNNNTDKYNITLPTVIELIGFTKIELTNEELAERADIESLMQEALSEAQTKIDEIVRKSLQLESQLIKINKPKIAKYVWQALSKLFKVAARGARVAYCTYSHIPQLNVSLHHISDGVDCYSYSKRLLLRIEQETVQVVKTIRMNVFSLAGIYKKIAGKKTLLGKLTTLLLNLSKIVRDIQETYLIGVNTLDKLENELPDAAMGSVNCGRNFTDSVTEMVETVTNLTSCIMFVDNTTSDYDFLKPENERDFK